MELHSKSLFIDKLLQCCVQEGPAYDRFMASEDMSPAEIKALEKHTEQAKTELQTIKRQSEDAKHWLVQQGYKLLQDVQGPGRDKLKQAFDFLEECKQLWKGIQELQTLNLPSPDPSTKTLAQLQSEHDTLTHRILERQARLTSLRANHDQLTRLQTHHQADVARLQDSLVASKQRLSELTTVHQVSAQECRLQQAQWYKHMTELMQQLTKCKAEMIRPDYILVTLSPLSEQGWSYQSLAGSKTVPVHLSLDPKTGVLIDCQIGSSSTFHVSRQNAPDEEWREIIQTAIDHNNISMLVRQIACRLNGIEIRKDVISYDDSIHKEEHSDMDFDMTK